MADPTPKPFRTVAVLGETRNTHNTFDTIEQAQAAAQTGNAAAAEMGLQVRYEAEKSI